MGKQVRNTSSHRKDHHPQLVQLQQQQQQQQLTQPFCQSQPFSAHQVVFAPPYLAPNNTVLVCEENVKVAKSFGRADLAEIWLTLQRFVQNFTPKKVARNYYYASISTSSASAAGAGAGTAVGGVG